MKSTDEGLILNGFFIIFLATVHTIINLSGLALIKESVRTFSFETKYDLLYFLFRSKTLAGVFLIATGFLLMIKILSVSRFIYIIPLTSGISFLVTAVISTIFFHEPFTLRMAVGMFVILCGISIIS